MLRFWNRIQLMNDDRITKKIFIWEKNLLFKGWVREIKNVFSEVDMETIYENNECISLEQSWARLHEKQCVKWKNEVLNSRKLGTYNTYKLSYYTEPFVYKKATDLS